MSTTYQNTISYGLFAVIGVAVLTVGGWTIYRLVIYIRQECMGIQPTEEVEVESVKEKSIYEKVKQSSSQRISVNLDKELKDMNEEKEMNVSELGFEDER